MSRSTPWQTPLSACGSILCLPIETNPAVLGKTQRSYYIVKQYCKKYYFNYCPIILHSFPVYKTHFEEVHGHICTKHTKGDESQGLHTQFLNTSCITRWNFYVTIIVLHHVTQSWWARRCNTVRYLGNSQLCGKQLLI